MLSDNDRFRDFLGVTAWHKAGYTGSRGLSASAEDFVTYQNGSNHHYQTYSVFKEIAPDREVVYLPMIGDAAVKGSAQQVLSRKVDTMFDANFLETSGEFLNEPLSRAAPFLSYFAAAGNFEDDKYCGYLDCDYIYGVGAYNLMAGTNEIIPAPYTSVTDQVDFCAPAGLFVRNPDGKCGVKFAGTSCAAPVLCGMAALVNDFFLDRTGKPLSGAMMYQFLKDCARDVGAAGKDNKTGWGAPRLPAPETIDIERYAGKMFNSRDIELLRPDVAANCKKLIELARADGWPVLVTGTVRDKEYQEYCYYKGTSKSKVPTFHSQAAGLAFDICKNVKGQEYGDSLFWDYCGALGKRMGFTWGGDWASFVDKPHFQWDENGRYGGNDILAGRYPPPMPLFEQEDEMTQEQFNALYNGVNPMYATIDDVPSYWQEETRALITAGKLKGDGTGNINIRHETLRAIIVAER